MIFFPCVMFYSQQLQMETCGTPPDKMSDIPSCLPHVDLLKYNILIYSQDRQTEYCLHSCLRSLRIILC